MERDLTLGGVSNEVREYVSKMRHLYLFSQNVAQLLDNEKSGDEYQSIIMLALHVHFIIDRSMIFIRALRLVQDSWNGISRHGDGQTLFKIAPPPFLCHVKIRWLLSLVLYSKVLADRSGEGSL